MGKYRGWAGNRPTARRGGEEVELGNLKPKSASEQYTTLKKSCLLPFSSPNGPPRGGNGITRSQGSLEAQLLAFMIIPAGGDMTCHRWPAKGCGTGWSTLLWRTATRCLHELQEMVAGEGTDVLAERVAEREGANTNEWDWAPTLGSDAEGDVPIRVTRDEDEKCALTTHLRRGESL